MKLATLAAGAAAAGLIALGGCALVAPARMSAGYGVPAATPGGRSFVRATGARDLALGLLLAGFIARAERASTEATLLVLALLAAADFSIAASAKPRSTQALAVHGGGAVSLVLIRSALRAGW